MNEDKTTSISELSGLSYVYSHSLVWCNIHHVEYKEKK